MLAVLGGHQPKKEPRCEWWWVVSQRLSGRPGPDLLMEPGELVREQERARGSRSKNSKRDQEESGKHRKEQEQEGAGRCRTPLGQIGQESVAPFTGVFNSSPDLTAALNTAIVRWPPIVPASSP